MSDVITTYEGLAALHKTGTRVWGVTEFTDEGTPFALICGIVGEVWHGYLVIKSTDDGEGDVCIYKGTRNRLWFFREKAPARAKHDDVCRAWLARRREEDIRALREEAGWEGTP